MSLYRMCLLSLGLDIIRPISVLNRKIKPEYMNMFALKNHDHFHEQVITPSEKGIKRLKRRNDCTGKTNGVIH